MHAPSGSSDAESGGHGKKCRGVGVNRCMAELSSACERVWGKLRSGLMLRSALIDELGIGNDEL